MIIIIYVRVKIDKTQQKNKCYLCSDKDEGIDIIENTEN